MTNTPVNNKSVETAERDLRRAKEAASETRTAAFRAAAIWMPFGPVLCIVLLAVLKKAIISAQELATEQAGFATEPFMPFALMAALGACYGAFVAWRVTNSSGAVGGPVLLVTAACMLMTFVGGAIGAIFVFEGGVPGFAWLAILTTTLFGLLTAWLVNKALG
ncbi:MAG: hypothetical protein H6819_02605 [Phycisphaerales bacterium]|nr:hypothetical protein [Phycisphaerales bacterium]MCB9856896.1 hypothetical protein [Phycisphaerales bacterium]MCB9861977.1 hypothetical protein [Phycisphaerales bacterium]